MVFCLFLCIFINITLNEMSTQLLLLQNNNSLWPICCVALALYSLHFSLILQVKIACICCQFRAKRFPVPMLTVIWNHRNKLQSNLNPNAIIFIQEKAFENAVCKMSAILFRPQCFKLCQCQHHVWDFSADSTRKVYQRKLERLLRGLR